MFPSSLFLLSQSRVNNVSFPISSGMRPGIELLASVSFVSLSRFPISFGISLLRFSLLQAEKGGNKCGVC